MVAKETLQNRKELSQTSQLAPCVLDYIHIYVLAKKSSNVEFGEILAVPFSS
jgi:hypothetical protein